MTVAATASRQDVWPGTGFRPDIQGLRAIAVSLVLLSHAGFTWASGGYIGVDVFFVVSGFLITSLLVKESFATGTISLAGFFSRRARRILPAATAVTVVTAIAAWLWFPITRFEAVMNDALAVVAYVVNYRFVVENTEYLNADALPSPFQQYWSLAVEEQFYLVWPLALLCLLLAFRRRPEVARRAAIGFVVLAFVVSLITSVVITASSQTTAYYATHTRVWELAGGAFLALTLPTWRKVPQAIALACGVIGLIAVLAAGFSYDDTTAFPGYAALAPVLGTMLLIVGGTARGTNAVTRLLSTPPFQYVGKISYSLYLWHWPLIVLGPLALGVTPSVGLNLVLLAVAVGVAQLSYTWIETPVRTARPLQGRNRYGLAAGALCSVLAVATVVSLTTAFSRVPDGGAVDLTSVQAVADLPALQEQLRAGLEVDRVPDDLVPALAHVDKDAPTPYLEGCHLPVPPTTYPTECAYGDVDSDTVVVLFGDSHAAQWFPALDALATEKGWRLLSRTKSSCTPAAIPVASTSHDGEYTECRPWRANVLEEIDRIRPALVVMGTSDNEGVMGAPGTGAREWAQGWTDTLEQLAASTDHMVTLTDTPRTGTVRAADCLSLHEDDVQSCLRESPYAIAAKERREAGIAAQRDAGATVVDTYDWFCIDGQCPMIVDDLLVYRDLHHISTPYARFLSGVLFQALPEI